MFKSQEEIKKYFEEYYYDEEIVLFDNLDYCSAFIGVSNDNRAIYDYDLMIDYLLKTKELNIYEAVEYIDYNTIRALSYNDKSLIILYNCNYN